MSIPSNLPTGTPTLAYTNTEDDDILSEDDVELKSLENYAHDRKVLFSSDALRYIAVHTASDDTYAFLDRVIAKAKASFPSEDGWVVVNLTRLESIQTESEEVVATYTTASGVGSGSLAEAIVTGNLASAYQLIENRPMLALAEATSELDAVYRMYQGNPTGDVIVSELLKTEIGKHPIETLKYAIDALTSALDGTYTSEESAVKMAIMKAVQIFAT